MARKKEQQAQIKTVLGIRTTFEAAHYLPDKTEYGYCRNIHGHSYKLIVELSGLINPELGWICNFKTAKVVVAEILRNYDHRMLNQECAVPTAELIAQQLFLKLSVAFEKQELEIESVTLYETENCYVRVAASEN